MVRDLAAAKNCKVAAMRSVLEVLHRRCSTSTGAGDEAQHRAGGGRPQQLLKYDKGKGNLRITD